MSAAAPRCVGGDVPALRLVRIATADDFESWRNGARALLAEGVRPEQVIWQVDDDHQPELFVDAEPVPPAPVDRHFSVPRAFLNLAQQVVLANAPNRFSDLYALVFRLQDMPGLLGDQTDPLVRKLESLAQNVRRDIHKMRAFLRFREVDDGGTLRMVGWFEPDHHILRANARFFVNRFANMRWSILTPELSIHWDGAGLNEGPGATRADAPEDDPVEAVWKTYYASIFNPARVKVDAMLKEMPRRYWKNMPETALIPELLASAQARETGMIAQARVAPTGDAAQALRALGEEAQHCSRCPLHRPASGTVFGQGPADAELMLVGEQPGDQEDIAGMPFVGPAGQMLDRALVDAGLDRARLYLTNAVKHFKFEPRGKRRLHARPNAGEIEACRWWLDQERLLVRPRMIVALGATAARSLLGRPVTIVEVRGQAIPLDEQSALLVTIHPSFLLRLPDPAEAVTEYGRFVDDLRRAGDTVAPHATDRNK
ncbi:uracil-DNA glycosylase [Sphingomonas sp. DBB INV C78]|uniref:UdgX family uracil-DNA binding protein n=1 Tax=Sphingomonas sp. DBB INV C78 TaxID=3349434 RepID=UPI0036D2483C